MKKSYFVIKLTGSLLALSFFLSANVAQACSPIEGFVHPTPESILQEGGGVFMTKITGAGSQASGMLMFSTFSLPVSIQHVVSPHSCSSRFNDLSINEYIVTVSPQDYNVVVNFNQMQGQFSYSFNNQVEAEAKFNELITIPDEPLPIVFVIPDMVEIEVEVEVTREPEPQENTVTEPQREEITPLIDEEQELIVDVEGQGVIEIHNPAPRPNIFQRIILFFKTLFK